MKKNLSLHLLFGFLLAGSSVVADDACPIATGNQTNAHPRCVSAIPLEASAMDAVSATTSNLNVTMGVTGTNALPPLPPDVTELKFNDIFRLPIGPRGLEYTDRLRQLEGRRIRILGYMVRQDKPVEHRFLLSPRPVTLHEREYGHADDLPVTTIHVVTSPEAPAQTPFTPGLLLLTGKLSLGDRLEADGRTSTVRLELDPPTPEQKRAMEEALAMAQRSSARPDQHAGHSH